MLFTSVSLSDSYHFLIFQQALLPFSNLPEPLGHGSFFYNLPQSHGIQKPELSEDRMHVF